MSLFQPKNIAYGIATVVILSMAALALTPLVGSEFVPETDQGFTQLALRMPVGSSLERTDAKVRQIE